MTESNQILYPKWNVEEIPEQKIKDYKIFRNQLRDNIIDFIERNNIALPAYSITLSYYQKHKKREIITKQHRFIRNQLQEVFNQRHRGNPQTFSNFFFIERHKKTLQSSCGNIYYLFNQVKTNNQVKNNLTNIKEYDFVDNQIVEGSFHTHLLVSDIPKKLLFNPTGKVKHIIARLTGNNILKDTTDDYTLEEIKKEMFREVCKRSYIVGNSNAAIDVVKVKPNQFYDGYYGWKGMIAYATKSCYNSYMMTEVIDNDNSSMTYDPLKKTIPIQQRNRYTFYDENYSTEK